MVKIYEYDIANNLISKNEVSDGTLFVFDGCHKIYLIEDTQDIKEVKHYWGKDTTFYDIADLKECYENACSLRFISNWKLTKQYVRQFNNAKIYGYK